MYMTSTPSQKLIIDDYHRPINKNIRIDKKVNSFFLM